MVSSPLQYEAYLEVTNFGNDAHRTTINISEGGPGRIRREVEIQPGQSQFEAQVTAYEQAWSALPGSVTHIIVIRDTPKAFTRTHGCIEHAIASGTSAGATYRMPRRAVLDRDAAVAAAAQLGSGRVQVVDLTDHFCDRDWCYPVIGGALVQKDINHLTATFVETLGPYLVADVQQLMSSWDQ